MLWLYTGLPCERVSNINKTSCLPEAKMTFKKTSTAGAGDQLHHPARQGLQRDAERAEGRHGLPAADQGPHCSRVRRQQPQLRIRDQSWLWVIKEKSLWLDGKLFIISEPTFPPQMIDCLLVVRLIWKSTRKCVWTFITRFKINDCYMSIGQCISLVLAPALKCIWHQR